MNKRRRLDSFTTSIGLSTGVSALGAPETFHWTQLQNIMRDPFENNVGHEQKDPKGGQDPFSVSETLGF